MRYFNVFGITRSSQNLCTVMRKKFGLQDNAGKMIEEFIKEL